MTSTSFRDSMNSLGWSRRVPEVPANTSSSTPILSKLSSFNPFKSGGYVQLPTHEAPGAPLPAPSRREEEEGWFACKLGFEKNLKPGPMAALKQLPFTPHHSSTTDQDQSTFRCDVI
jgi:hypothetical protein